MIVLQETTSPQTIYFIPREMAADSMVIHDEAQNTNETINITPTEDEYYLTVTEVFELVEDRSYTLTVYNGTDIVYKDKIFCTNQNAEDYSINEGEYIQHESDNEFIVIE